MGSSHPPALKRFGQNFLIDHNIARKIIGLAAIQPHETVLEIGPGRGILTRGLCAEARTVIAIEIDRQLARLLGRPPAENASWSGKVMESDVPPLAAQCSNLDLRIGDALEFSYETLPCGTVVVANLPYYVSTPLLFKLLESYSRIDRMVLMLQTEVALRLVASPDTKDVWYPLSADPVWGRRDAGISGFSGTVSGRDRPSDQQFSTCESNVNGRWIVKGSPLCEAGPCALRSPEKNSVQLSS